MKLWKIIKRIFSSHAFVMFLFGFLYGMTAISPDILKNPTVFCNYIGFIALNVWIQEIEKRDSEREWQNKIDNLQRQINNLKRGLTNYENNTCSGHDC